MSAMSSLTKSAALVLEHAEFIGLPEPYNVEVHGADQPVWLAFESVAQVAEWASWLGVQISEREHPGPALIAGAITHEAIGHALDLPVKCWALTTSEVPT